MHSASEEPQTEQLRKRLGVLHPVELSLDRLGSLLYLVLNFLGIALAARGTVMGAALAVTGNTTCETTQARAGKPLCACGCTCPHVTSKAGNNNSFLEGHHFHNWHSSSGQPPSLSFPTPNHCTGSRARSMLSSGQRKIVQVSNRPLSLVTLGPVKAYWPVPTWLGQANNPSCTAHPSKPWVQELGLPGRRAPAHCVRAKSSVSLGMCNESADNRCACIAGGSLELPPHCSHVLSRVAALRHPLPRLPTAAPPS